MDAHVDPGVRVDRAGRVHRPGHLYGRAGLGLVPGGQGRGPNQEFRARLCPGRGRHRALRPGRALAHPLLPGAQPLAVGDLRRSLHPALAAALCGLGRVAHRAHHAHGRHPALAGSLLRIAPLRVRPREPAPWHAVRGEHLRRRERLLPGRVHRAAAHRRAQHQFPGRQFRSVAGRGHRDRPAVRRRWPAAPKGPSLDELAAQANPAENQPARDHAGGSTRGSCSPSPSRAPRP